MPDLDQIRKMALEGDLNAPPAPEPKPAPEMARAYPGTGRAWAGDIVLLTGRFRGHAVVCSARYIERGKRAGMYEYSLAPMADGQFGKNAYAVRTAGESFSKPTKTFTKAEAQARMEGKNATAMGVEERKEARAERGRDALGERALAKGDKIWVAFSDGRRIERVVDINESTGKVAIERAQNKSGKRWIPATLCTKIED